MRHNLNPTHRFNGRMAGAAIVNNLLDEPSHDPTFDVHPFFPTADDDPCGREAFVQFSHRFH